MPTTTSLQFIYANDLVIATQNVSLAHIEEILAADLDITGTYFNK